MLYIREADVLVTLARLDCFVHDLVGAETRLETAHTVLTSQHSYTKAISDTPTDQVPQGKFVYFYLHRLYNCDDSKESEVFHYLFE